MKPYAPARELYSSLGKPDNLQEIQHSFISNEEEFFAHPLNLHSELANLNKFWAKENNYFERYQIMTSKKVGTKVGDLGKVIPFTNFKVFGKG